MIATTLIKAVALTAAAVVGQPEYTMEDAENEVSVFLLQRPDCVMVGNEMATALDGSTDAT